MSKKVYLEYAVENEKQLALNSLLLKHFKINFELVTKVVNGNEKRFFVIYDKKIPTTKKIVFAYISENERQLFGECRLLDLFKIHYGILSETIQGEEKNIVVFYGD